MKCQDIIEMLERIAPRDYALDWDNVGLLVGRRDSDIKKVVVALDATEAVCKQAVELGADMIVTHHPMIFSKVGRINGDTPLGRKILALAKADISCYAMHTNFDTIGGMAKLAAGMLGIVAGNVLEETKDGFGIGEIGDLESAVTVRELAKRTKEAFNVSNVSVFGDMDTYVKKIAICPGSGKSVIDEAISRGADCLVTGDIGHHDGIDAVEAGLIIIDASHYGIEKLFIRYIGSLLREAFAELEVIEIDVGEPFTVVG